MTQIFNRTEKKPLRQELRLRSTHAEEILWRKLKDRRLAGVKFKRQYSIGRYVADFYCPVARLAVEIDGGVHSTTEAKGYDKIRDDFIQELGLRVLRFTNDEVYFGMESVLQTIAHHVSAET